MKSPWTLDAASEHERFFAEAQRCAERVFTSDAELRDAINNLRRRAEHFDVLEHPDIASVIETLEAIPPVGW